MTKEMYYQQALFVCLGGIVLFFWMAQPWLLGAWIVGCFYWAYLKVSQMPKSKTVQDVDVNEVQEFMTMADMKANHEVTIYKDGQRYQHFNVKKDFLDCQRRYLVYKEMFCGPNAKENLNRFFGQMSEADLALLREKLLIKNVFTEEEKERYLYPAQRDQEYLKVSEILSCADVDENKQYPDSCYLYGNLKTHCALVNDLCEEAIGLTVFN